MPNQVNLKDKKLRATGVGPIDATTTYTSAIDLGHNNTTDDFVAPVEFLLTAPALTTSQLADTKTVTYSIVTDNDSAFGSLLALLPSVIVQTGAGGAGAAAAEYRFRAPANVERYLKGRAVGVASGGNASAATFTLEVLS